MPSHHFAVITPLANESVTVDRFVSEVLQHAPAESTLYCVLDNASRDDTLHKVNAWSTQNPRVSVVWSPNNRCVVDAYVAGYRAALVAGARWILEMDGGFSHDPAHIPRFVAAMEKGVDFAAGTRFGSGGRFLAPLGRRLTSQGGTWLANAVLRTRMSDMTSGYQCFTSRALSAVLAHGIKSRAHFFQTEIRYLLHDWQWTEVPIDYRNTVSHVPLSSIRESVRNLIWLRSQQRLSPPK